MILAFSGGVGGARMCAGLAQVLDPGRLLVVVNNGDDFDHWGLRICPDLDTVMYTLAGKVDESQGWGLAGETWASLGAMAGIGGEDWFRIGDRDLATHLLRSAALHEGASLSHATAALMARFGVVHRVAPSTDDRHRTVVHTDEGTLAFQEYFVRRRCEPALRAVSFDSSGPAGMARPAPAFAEAIAGDEIEAVVICPSNPILSILPLLELAGVRDWLGVRRFPVIAVSPLIGGLAVKGPAAKIFGELGLQASVAGLARWYEGLVDGWLVDTADAGEAARLGCGVRTRACNTLLSDHARRREVATELLGWLRDW